MEYCKVKSLWAPLSYNSYNTFHLGLNLCYPLGFLMISSVFLNLYDLANFWSCDNKKAVKLVLQKYGLDL